MCWPVTSLANSGRADSGRANSGANAADAGAADNVNNKDISTIH
jgi:hypothetical protein